MLSGPVTGSTRATLQSIIQTSGGLQYVVLVTNCHPSLQTWAQVALKSFSVTIACMLKGQNGVFMT